MSGLFVFAPDGRELHVGPTVKPHRRAIAGLVAALRSDGAGSVHAITSPDGELLEVHLVRPPGLGGAVVGHVRVLEPGSAEHVAARCAEAGFTPKETAVARLAIRGRSNSEIARDLSLATDTVKQHLRSVFAKAGVAGRTELAAFLLAGWRP